MKVDLYNAGETTPYERDVDLVDALGDDAELFLEAKRSLEKGNAFHIGGGAAPHIILQRAQ
jgi:hypothetical protein